MAAVIGRENELARVESFLAEGRERFVVLVVEGEGGIGKTTVWRESTILARRRGYRVLSCRPAQSEAKLAYASLADLLGEISDDVLAVLPEPQRLALELALLRESAGARSFSSRTVGTAVLSVLGQLASVSPLLIAIDDVQWLDGPSATALGFAFRRLEDRPDTALLLALRVEAGQAADPLALEGTLRDRLGRVRLGPLTLSGLFHLIRERLGHTFPRPTLQRIEQASGGNPLFALELAEALVGADASPGPGDPLPVPEGLAGLMRARIARLPARTREALLAIASLSSPTTELVERALGDDIGARLDDASLGGVIEIRDGRIGFSHPLLATAVTSSTPPRKRREMHRRLAQLVDEPEEQAHHLALGAEGPDETTAARLDEAARLANSRGAPETAAELLELACKLTPPARTGDVARRRLELAEVVYRAGDTAAAERILQPLFQGGTEGAVRARALELEARMLWVDGTGDEAAARCREGLAQAGGDTELQAQLHATLAIVLEGDSQLAHHHAKTALDLLENVADPDPAVLGEALVAFATTEFDLGRGLPTPVVARALELERIAPPLSVADRMSAALGACLKYEGDFTGAKRWLEATHRAAIDEGDEGSLPYALSHLPQLELWTGNWPVAERKALEHLELAERTSQSGQRRQALYNLSLIHAHMGRVDDATAEAQEALTDAERSGDAWSVGGPLAVLGFVQLSLGNYEEAARRLRHALSSAEEAGATLQGLAAYENFIEALVLLGDLTTAERALADYQARARAVDRAMFIAPVFRCRALLAAARQQLDEAVEALEDALAQHEQVTVPFSLARSLLVLGQVRRRRGERRAAKYALEKAIGMFEELGAPLWAERARAELARIPMRRAASGRLTAGETRVAELAAQGLSTQEIAHSLFISGKTVEANLTRIYRKLGIRSRAALATRMAESTGEGSAPKT